MSIRGGNVLILGAQVPFSRGGAELLIDELKGALEKRGFEVDEISLPFNAQPKTAILKQIALWRSLDLEAFAGKKVDLVIGTKFPSYMVSHPAKVVWLVHQHRQLYELYGSRFGDFDGSPEDESLRRMVLDADRKALGECAGIYTISSNVSSRLKRYMNFDSTVLAPPPPLSGHYRSEEPEDYILSVGRICSIKRVDLIVKAMPMINQRLRLKIVGTPDEPAIEEYLRSEIEKHHLWDRVEFLGRVDEETLLSLYARAFAVYYAPYDEDYGFVTLEALRSSRPVVTAEDSGMVLEYIRDERNGLVVEPNDRAIAKAFNRLYDDGVLYDRLRQQCVEYSESYCWDEIIDNLTSSLQISQPYSRAV